jgi:hypothetical protein
LPGNFPFQGPQPLSTFIVLSGLYLAHAILRALPEGGLKYAFQHILQDPSSRFLAASGCSPLLAFASTNLATRRRQSTPDFFQAFSALFSKSVRFCKAVRDPPAVYPSGCFTIPASATVTGTCRSCLFFLAIDTRSTVCLSKRQAPVPPRRFSLRPRLQRFIPQDQCVRLNSQVQDLMLSGQSLRLPQPPIRDRGDGAESIA